MAAKSNPASRAAKSPVRIAAPTPRFRGCEITRSAPAWRASSAVASPEASSTTITVEASRLGTLRTTSPILPTSRKAGTTTATRAGSITSSHSAEALAHQEGQVGPAVPPLLELDLPLPEPVRNVLLAEAEALEQRLELDLLAERHAVRRESQAIEQRPAEHPHPRLAVADRLAEEQRGGDGEDAVADLIRPAHGPLVRQREAASGQEIPSSFRQNVHQPRNVLGRVAAVAIEGHDHVAARLPEPCLVGGPVAAPRLAHHLSAGRARHFGGAIGAGVVHHDHLIDGRRNPREHLAHASLLVVAGNHQADAKVPMHAISGGGAKGRATLACAREARQATSPIRTHSGSLPERGSNPGRVRTGSRPAHRRRGRPSCATPCS